MAVPSASPPVVVLSAGPDAVVSSVNPSVVMPSTSQSVEHSAAPEATRAAPRRACAAGSAEMPMHGASVTVPK
eukprot:5095955-Lingulodinium_polyedra.AAC.1